MLQDLAFVSVPFQMSPPLTGGIVQGYQRSIDIDHANAIKRYMQDGKPRFIPEIILSVRVNFRPELDNQQRQIGTISDDLPGLVVRRRWQSKSRSRHQILIERSKYLNCAIKGVSDVLTAIIDFT